MMNAQSRSADALRKKFVSLFANELGGRVDYIKQTKMFVLIYVGCPLLCTCALMLSSFGFFSIELTLGVWTGALGYSIILYLWVLMKDARMVNASLQQVFLRNRGMQRELSASSRQQWADCDIESLSTDEHVQREIPKLKIVR